MLYTVLLSVCLVRLCTALLSTPGSWEPLKEIHNDYVSVEYPLVSAKPKLFSYAVNDTVASTGRPYTMYVAVLQSDVASSFSLELPYQGTGYSSTNISYTRSSLIFEAFSSNYN